ncbi:ABC transporter transmembrane domain-containing protein [Spiroplasma tabanidicola]|uniref:ABC transporter transmembrane domain-containing protein n=1 Tax=Spiroplasma tabanidicola TaxID=324079 RepID=UPI0012DE0BD6|nr:ABC transporter ATP-binding protein [Spiroplasma tabanidicola]
MKKFNKTVWFNYFIYSFLSLLSNACYVAMSYAFSFIIDSAIDKNLNKFLIASGTACGLILGHLILDYICDLILNSSLAIINNNLRKIVAYNTFKENYELKLDSGEFINLNSNKVNQLANSYYKNIFEITNCCLAIIVGFGFIAYISWISLLSCIILSILIIIVPSIMSKTSQKVVNIANDKNDKFLQTTKDSFNSYWVYWSMNETKQLIEKINTGSKILEAKNRKKENILNFSNLLFSVILFLGQVILIILFSWMYLAGFIKSIGTITTLNIISGVYCFFGGSSVRSLMGILSYKNVVKIDFKDIKDNINLVAVQKLDSIELKNLNFKYDDHDNHVIKDFNLSIIKNDKVLIQGESGAGKSTLLKLIFNSNNASQGQVFINGVNLKEYDIRPLCAYIGQDIVLTKGTILKI